MEHCIGETVPDINYLPSLYKEYIDSPSPTVFDIGSRDGDDAHFMAESLGASNVYIFECHPTCFYRIKNKYPQYNNIKIAVSNFTGESTFNSVMTNDIELGVSSLKDRYDDWYKVRDVNKITVNVDTMKNLIDKHNIELPIDLVKIDVEGCSYEVLEGFGEYLQQVKMIHVEVEEYQIWEEQKLASDVSTILTDNGFKMVDHRYYGHQVADDVWVNLRYAKK
jgi:FkbM family methyltransferase